MTLMCRCVPVEPESRSSRSGILAFCTSIKDHADTYRQLLRTPSFSNSNFCRRITTCILPREARSRQSMHRPEFRIIAIRQRARTPPKPQNSRLPHPRAPSPKTSPRGVRPRPTFISISPIQLFHFSKG
ncbi:hypothetical protein BOTBODRAFT_229520 [Botryobasidium botryosum FD-172 SS1]|uniref:Uncharacterized protein n=1 Tax=Botryobasidium botryosum (strain FD-172 SS1) TaxID=930990 RepID=A0A067LXE5_BOTB1|nr:hypothetical protein BOTBODRAFT_229520 [Botryobasidium botryosum FD-172 SS1]